MCVEEEEEEEEEEEVAMDGGLTITFISVAMFVGCFLLGFIPLLFRLSEVGVAFLISLIDTHIIIIMPQ